MERKPLREQLAAILLSSLVWLLVGLTTAFLFLIVIGVAFPISLIGDRERRFPQAIARLWARGILGFLSPYCRLQVYGKAHLKGKGPYIVIANHQSLLDILLVLATLTIPLRFVAKKELFGVPFIGWYISLARYIRLDRSDKESGRHCLREAADLLKRGISVVFFPEGTRSLNGEIHPFKIGAFKLAVELRIPILPLVISGTRTALPKRSLLLSERAEMKLFVEPPCETVGISADSIESFRDRLRERMIYRLGVNPGGY